MSPQRLPILMYHALHDPPDERADPVYSVTPAEFERQLDWLREFGFRSVRLHDPGAKQTGDKTVVISFDDGDATNRSIALPLLTARGMVAEFFITSDFIGQPGMVSENDVRALAEAGMGVSRMAAAIVSWRTSMPRNSSTSCSKASVAWKV